MINKTDKKHFFLNNSLLFLFFLPNFVAKLTSEMIEKKLLKDITLYCETNGLDTKRYLNKLLKNAFMVDKYGEKPAIFATEEPQKPKVTRKRKSQVSEIVETPAQTTEPPTKKVEVIVSEKNETTVSETASKTTPVTDEPKIIEVKKPRKRTLS